MSPMRVEYIRWIQDAHAMEGFMLCMLGEQAGNLDHSPQLRARLEMHIGETREHARQLCTILDRLGQSPAAQCGTCEPMTTTIRRIAAVADLDGPVRASFTAFALKHVEIASYQVLIVTADKIGDGESKGILKTILSQEMAMADWLADHQQGRQPRAANNRPVA